VTDPLRLAIVEDNDVFREALELLLGLQPDIEIVAALSDGTGVIEMCRDLQPDVIVMDYRLPGLDGVQATAARERGALIEAGAVACLTKDEPLDEIVAAIHRAGGRFATAE
jgi:DNA-binding NarL/FixJ family response regulator